MANIKNRNDYFFGWLARLIKIYLLFSTIFILYRVSFTTYFGDLTELMAFKWDLVYAFFLGWKYDNIVITYLLIPVYLFAALASLVRLNLLNNLLVVMSRFYVSIASILVSFLLICDLGFYTYFQDHINILFYGLIEDDTVALLETLWKNYPIIIYSIGLLFISSLLIWLTKKSIGYFKKDGSRAGNSFLLFIFSNTIILILMFGSARGGYSDVVIAPHYSDFSRSEFINQVSLNGIITLEKAVRIRQSRGSQKFNLAKKFGYAQDIKSAFSDYLGLDLEYTKHTDLIKLLYRRTDKSEVLGGIKPHVLVIVMESFGSSWNKYHSKEFPFLGGLEKHFAEDLYFKNFISSGNGTIGSLMTIASNIPFRPGARYLSESQYMQLPLESSAHYPYKENGYETSFFYGGKLGWRDIGKYFRYQNYHNIIGENYISEEFKLEKKSGTEWGLYDEHLFNALFSKLKNAKRPQFMLALSTTNHPPFEIPKNYDAPNMIVPEDLESKIKREQDIFKDRFRAFEYSNKKLSELLSQIKQSDLSQNTIVAITGDHNFWGFINFDKTQTYEKHLVPLYFYIPEKLKPTNIDLAKVGSHEDILTSLYNVSLSEAEYLSFGENLFTDSASFAINQKLYASNNGIVYKDKDYNWSEKPLMEDLPVAKYLNQLRRHYKSSLSVSDYYLRWKLKESQNKD